MKRTIVISTIIILVLSFAAGVIYLNNVYLPVKVKGQFAEGLSSLLKYDVEIGRFRFNPFKGVILEDIVVYDRIKDKKNTILSVKNASFQFLFFPLFKERKIIIPIININSPNLNLRRLRDKTFNFSRALPAAQGPAAPGTAGQTQKPPDKKPDFSFLVYKINISGAEGSLEDESVNPAFSAFLHDLYIVIGLRQLTKIGFACEGKLVAGKNQITDLSLKGDYNLFSQSLNSRLKVTGLAIADFHPYLKNLPLSISNGVIDNCAWEINFKDNFLNAKGAVSAKNLELTKDGMLFAGDINFEPDLVYGVEQKKLDYKAGIKIIRANLDGAPYVKNLSNISAEISVIKDRLSFDSLKAQALGSSYTLRGTLESFLDPNIKINLKSEAVDLEKALAVLPSNMPGISLKGTAAADINIEGRAAKPPLAVKGSIQPNGAKLQAVFLKEPVSNIKGKFDFTLDSVNWPALSFDYLGASYNSSGSLENFRDPEANLILVSKELNLKSAVKIKNRIAGITLLNGKYKDSFFDIKGTVDINDTSDPMMDLTGTLDFKPEDTFAFLTPALLENMKKIKPEGILNLKGKISGKAGDYRNWNFTINGGADNFSAYGLKFTGINFSGIADNGLVDIGKFNASAYSGKIKLNFRADLKPQIPAYYINFSGSGIDLAQLRGDTEYKDKKLAGILDVDGELSGDLSGTQSIKGSGSLNIKEGKLWEFSLFKGLGEIFLIPDFENITFKEAFGELGVENNAVYTENIRLTSDQINLDCRGTVGLDGVLDLTIYTQANQNVIRDSADIRKFTAAILGELGSALTIRVTGTLQKPHYNIVPVAVDVIKSLKNFILGK